jgi:hypothetical protein
LIAALLTPAKAKEHHKFPPACQNSFREARHHENWGLSNAIFWGKLFRRRHLFNWTAPRRTFDLAARFNHGASEPGLKCLGRNRIVSTIHA